MRTPPRPAAAAAAAARPLSSSSSSKPSAAPIDDEMDPTSRPPGLRKKSAGVRPWLLIDSSGQAQLVEAGKHSIMRRTGLPARDLRILDPLLSYPSIVLGRERAIVINLEHIKAIITAQEVLLLNSKDPSVTPFVDELQRRISRFHHAQADHQEGRIGSNGGVDWNTYHLEELRSRMVSPHCSGSLNSSENLQRFQEVNEKGKGDGKAGFENGPRVLPFEFIALEACLEAACSCLDNEARTLEQEAHPALDKLTSKISTLNLERVRQIKSRLVAITGRVQKVRDELEQLLDDDEDMAEMYLTDKLKEQHLDGSSVTSLNERDGIDDSVLRADVDANRVTAAISLPPNDVLNIFESDDSPDHSLASSPDMLNGDSHGTHAGSSRCSSKHLDVEELEMLLEAYFVQIDGTLNNLSALREYVDDTEDYINIMLDDKQNHLLQMGVMLTTATLVVSALVVVAGIFGMNITIELFDKTKSGMPEFLWTVGGGATGSIFLYIIAIAWCKRKRLLE